MSSRSAPEQFTVAFVCTGNRFRSILAELVQLLDRIGVTHRPDPIEQANENLMRAQAGRNGEPRRTVVEIEDPISLPEAAQRAIAQAVYSSAETLAAQLFGRAK